MAGAHIEREPIFVDPAADRSIRPAAGGDFVKPRPLALPANLERRFARAARSAWRKGRVGARRGGLVRSFSRVSPGRRARALRLVRRLGDRHGGPGPRAAGLTARVTAERTLVVCRSDSMARLRRSLSTERLRANPAADRRAKRALLRLNRAYARMCRFRELQPAFEAARNGDTVVLMPGFYEEPTARRRPHNDPRCAELVDGTGAPSYEYHRRCPNDISMATLIGKDSAGRCLRCNVHVRGSGARPEDVLLEGGVGVRDPGVRKNLFERGKGPAEGAKEVGIRLERADGAALTNMTIRNTSEHGVYAIETDGVTFRDLRLYYSHEYGHLTFVTDHQILEDTEAAGSADAGVYPGASPPSRPRINTIVRRVNAHHNVIGLSGTMGSNIRIVDNRFHNNSTGISLDSFYRTGHPGFPQNSSVIARNKIHSNNFDTYSREAWVRSSVQAPIGVGVLIVGGNDNLITDNRIYDNWRWGSALISVPDALSNNLEHAPELPQDLRLSTSHRNRHEGNAMGLAPRERPRPNGTDFWWDEFGRANCWENNRSPAGPPSSDPVWIAGCTDFPVVDVGVQAGWALKAPYLASCAFALEREPGAPVCDWFDVPSRPAR